MDESCVAERATNTLACFLERGIGQTDDREPRQPGSNVDLDPDQPAVEAVECRGWDDGQHSGSLRADAHPTVNGRSPAPYPGRNPRSAATRAGSYLVRALNCRVAVTGTTSAAGLSMLFANCTSDVPSAELDFEKTNGDPELSALIAPRYSFTT